MSAQLKANIIKALRKFAAQRSGLEYGNYGDIRFYDAEKRAITRDLADAKILISAVEESAMTAEQLIAGFSAYQGRLAITVEGDDVRLEYTVGQYFPVEYRRAVCAVCAMALWDYYRDEFTASAHPGESAGDAVRRRFREIFGKRIAAKWFS